MSELRSVERQPGAITGIGTCETTADSRANGARPTPGLSWEALSRDLSSPDAIRNRAAGSPSRDQRSEKRNRLVAHGRGDEAMFARSSQKI